MIKIFTIPLPDLPHERYSLFPLLEPFLMPEKMVTIEKSLNPEWKSHYCFADNPADADILVLPLDLAWYYFNKRLNEPGQLAELGTSLNKPVWFFTGGDQGISYPDKRVNLLRMGGSASSNKGNEFVMPPFIPDPLAATPAVDWSPQFWSPIPKVGFCGQADNSWQRRAKDYIGLIKKATLKLFGSYPFDLQPWFSTSRLRGDILCALEAIENVECTFIKHTKYKGGLTAKADPNASRRTYYDNISGSAYTVCVRGGGNYSVRFYDCLALGRIPLLVNTDAQLPLPGIIDWSKHICQIEAGSAERISQTLANYHQSFNEPAFETLQESNRNLWLHYLTFEGFFSHFHMLTANKSISHLY